MRIRTGMALVGLALAAGMRARAQQPEPADELREVRVYLEGGYLLSPPVLLQGRATAAKILAQAGVRLRWVSAKPPASGASESTHCERGCPAQTIILTLVDRAPASLPPGAWALALPYSRDFGRVNVFCDRIAGLLSALPHQAGVVLGHVLAHELTHVLQRVVRHSDTGIMQAHWTVRDLSAMSPKPLPFTPHDVYLIRDGIRRLTSTHAGAAPGGAPAVALTASTIAQERNP